MALYKLRWEQGLLNDFVSQFRILLTRCQGDGLYGGANEVLACDLFLKAISQHTYASEQLRRNQADKLDEWEFIIW